MGELGQLLCGCAAMAPDRLVALLDPAEEVLIELDAGGAVRGGFPHASALLLRTLCGAPPLDHLLPLELARLIADRADVVRTRGVATSVDLPGVNLRARLAPAGRGVDVLVRAATRTTTLATMPSDAGFWQLFEAAPLPLAVELAASSTVEGASYFNPRFTELFGYTAEDIPSVQHWWPRAYPDPAYRQQIRDEWFRRVERAVRDQAAIAPMEATVTCKDGSSRDIEFFAAAVGDRQVIVFVDLTARKRLQAAQAEVATLTELLPLCGWCKKLRDDRGYWQRLEEFFSQHLRTRVTHGICPECTSQHFGGRRTDS